jgi:hypothetical protein
MRTDQDARMLAGEDKVLEIAVANSTNADLVNCNAAYVIGSSAFGPDPALVSKNSNGVGIQIVVGAGVPAGYAILLKVTLENDDTAQVTPGWYYHEAVVTLATGAIITALVGQMRIDPSWLPSRA